MPTVQELIDAAAAPGGSREVKLAPGYYPGPQILLPGGCALIGSGHSTVVPPVRPPSLNDRTYGQRLEHLSIDGDILEGSSPYIAIDWRRITNGIIRDVVTRATPNGVLLAYECYYNLLEQVFPDASVDSFEIYAGANSNTIIGGKGTGPATGIAIQIINSNGTTVIGTSCEGPDGFQARKLVGETTGTRFVNVRHETTTFGPIWIND